ncbi:hypothetical protein Chor_001964 [Crotalus horridus]
MPTRPRPPYERKMGRKPSSRNITKHRASPYRGSLPLSPGRPEAAKLPVFPESTELGKAVPATRQPPGKCLHLSPSQKLSDFRIRYGGFYPQVRYHVGQSYGRTTSRMLTDPEVRKSPCSVLTPLRRPKFTEDFSQQKLPAPDRMDQGQLYIPGYTATETVNVRRFDRTPRLDLPNLIQRKAISGYAGFIPCITWIMGVNYLKGVKDAMNNFDRNQERLRNPMYSFGQRLPHTYWPNTKIYNSKGLVPFYTGFVPTIRENYALTFGNSTRQAYYDEIQRRQHTG